MADLGGRPEGTADELPAQHHATARPVSAPLIPASSRALSMPVGRNMPNMTPIGNNMTNTSAIRPAWLQASTRSVTASEISR